MYNQCYMAASTLSLLLMGLSCVSASHYVKVEHKIEPGCTAVIRTTSGLQEINLHKLQQSIPLFNISASGDNSDKSHFFAWKVCDSISLQRETENCTKSMFLYSTPSRCNSLGNETGFLVDNAELYLRFQTETDVHASAQIRLECNYDEEGTLSCDEEDDGCSLGSFKGIKFVLESKHVCLGDIPRKRQAPNLSTGSIVLIAGACVAVLYFVSGTLYGSSKGAKGLDRLPNSDFWQELPSLTKDGFAFAFRCKKPGVEYTPIVEDKNVPVVDL